MSVRRLFDLSGKVALVTGGSRGLGLQMAKALGEMGARLVLVARKTHELSAAVAELAADGIEAVAIPSDLGALETLPAVAVVDATLKYFDTIDILVNNAGAAWGAPAETHSAESWRKVMDLNLDACFFLAQEVGRRVMIPQRAGKIINIASVAGLSVLPPDWGIKTVAYHTSKAALIHLTRALAAEWGPYNINVNAICPGYFPSKLSAGLTPVAEKMLAMTPLGRAGGDEDLKGAIVFLASEASRHVTGLALPVDGGINIV